MPLSACLKAVHPLGLCSVYRPVASPRSRSTSSSGARSKFRKSLGTCSWNVHWHVPFPDMGMSQFFSVRFNSVLESFDSDSTHDSQWLSRNWLKSTHDSKWLSKFDSNRLPTQMAFQNFDSNRFTTKNAFQNFDSNQLMTQKTSQNFDSNRLMTQKQTILIYINSWLNYTLDLIYLYR